MAITLRPYQSAIIDNLRHHMKQGHTRMLVCSPTGSGKTALTAEMLHTAASRGKKCLFICHRRELILQSYKAIKQAKVSPGVVAAGFAPSYQQPVQLCSIQTLIRRLHKIKNPDLVIWDEAHHIAAKSWSKVFEHYSKAFHIGLTATPTRLDGRGLDDYFDHLVLGPSTAELIEAGYLCDYRYFCPAKIDLTGIRMLGGDFKKDQLQEAVDKPKITGSAILEYQKLTPGKRAVVFCVSVAHSKHVAEQFNAAGIRAEHVDGATPTNERDASIKRFRSGQTLVLTNVDLFGEGFDLPAIETCILLRPTASLSLHLQQVGRALRPSPGKKHAVILDHVENAQRHGLPDEIRDWSLKGFDKAQHKKSLSEPSVKICEKCFAAMPPATTKCQQCGAVTTRDREVEQVDGELQEIDKKALARKRKREEAGASTLQDLIQLGKDRGYKPGWAHKRWEARQKKRGKPWQQGKRNS